MNHEYLQHDAIAESTFNKLSHVYTYTFDEQQHVISSNYIIDKVLWALAVYQWYIDEYMTLSTQELLLHCYNNKLTKVEMIRTLQQRLQLLCNSEQPTLKIAVVTVREFLENVQEW